MVNVLVHQSRNVNCPPIPLALGNSLSDFLVRESQFLFTHLFWFIFVCVFHYFRIRVKEALELDAQALCILAQGCYTDCKNSESKDRKAELFIAPSKHKLAGISMASEHITIIALRTNQAFDVITKKQEWGEGPLPFQSWAFLNFWPPTFCVKELFPLSGISMVLILDSLAHQFSLGGEGPSGVYSWVNTII